MTDITNVINVEINLSTVSSIRAENFNLPLLLGTHTVFTDLYREYADPSEMLEDGFRLDSNEYKAATLMFNYDNPIPKIYVGRRLVSEVTLKVNTLKANYVYKTTIGTTVYTFSKATTPTALEVAAGLVEKISADPTVDVLDNLDGTYAITPKVSDTPFVCKADNYQVFQEITTGQDIIDDVNAILAATDDWFAIMETLRVKDEVVELAAWCETECKLFITVSNDANILESVDDDTTSIAAIFKEANYKFTAALYHASLTDFIDAAWLGEELRKNPGASMWALKTLTGITPDKITSVQRTNVLAKNCNVYEFIGGNGVTNYGTVFSDTYKYIDVVRDTEYLKTDIEVNLFQMLKDTNKVAYTDAGITMCENKLKQRLANAVTMGILTPNPAPTTTAPLAKDVSIIDKEQRILRNLNFNGELAGAIQQIKVVGSIQY